MTDLHVDGGGGPADVGTAGDDLRLVLPAEGPAVSLLRRRIRRWLSAGGVDEETAESVLLAADEAVTNVVEHAYANGPAGPLGLAVSGTPDGGVEVEVSDEGRWRPVPEDPGYRGRGLLMMRALAGDVEIEQGPRGTTVRLSWRGCRAAPAG